jgi:hypothetical protein
MTSTDLQNAIAGILEMPGRLPVSGLVLQRKAKDLASDVDVSVALHRGLAILVMPPVETSALQGVPFVYFDGYEVRVRIVEVPNANGTGYDAYALKDYIAQALHWQPVNAIEAAVAAEMSVNDLEAAAALAAVQASALHAPLFALHAMLGHPLYLAQRPVELVEGTADMPGFEHHEQFVRVLDVVFHAVIQVNPEEPAVATITASASPAEIPQTGGTYAVLTATARDQFGNPITAEVTWSATPSGKVTLSVVEDEVRATSIMTPGATATVTVRATVGSVFGTTTLTLLAAI